MLGLILQNPWKTLTGAVNGSFEGWKEVADFEIEIATQEGMEMIVAIETNAKEAWDDFST